MGTMGVVGQSDNAQRVVCVWKGKDMRCVCVGGEMGLVNPHVRVC